MVEKMGKPASDSLPEIDTAATHWWHAFVKQCLLMSDSSCQRYNVIGAAVAEITQMVPRLL